MKKSITISMFIFLLNFTCFYGILLAQNRSGLSLKKTFDLYVKSVQNSDLKNLFTTVTDQQEFFFLTSNGKMIDSREGYYKFHEEWFKETDWEMPVELIKAYEEGDFGYTLARFYFKGKTPEREAYFLDSYFTLIFHKEEGIWKVIADVCTPIQRYVSDTNSEFKYSSDQKYLFEMIKNRRTVRKFKSTPVPQEHIMKILDAARFAPTAGNQQPWKFLIVQNREKLDLLKEQALAWYLDAYQRSEKFDPKNLGAIQEKIKNVLENALSAPVYIAVLIDSQAKYSDYIIYDGTLAAGYLMIAARALGYGTGFFTTFFPEEKMKKFFNIPEQYKLICFTPIGIPEQWPDMPAKKELDDIVVFEEFK